MIRRPCARQAHFLYISLLQSRLICVSPLHSQLPGGPGTSLPFSGRRTQVSGVSHTGQVFLGLGHVSWWPLVSPGFAILQRVGKAARHCFSPPQLVFIAGQRHLPSVSWAKERALTLILPSGPVRRRTPSVCCSRAQGNGQGGSFSLHSPDPRTDGLHSPELSFLI